jgi:hypothetical protein
MVEKYNSESFTSMKELSMAIENMNEIRNAIVEGITHYSDFEKLNDHRQPWYANARDSYEDKLHKVDTLIMRLEMKLKSIPQETANASN